MTAPIIETDDEKEAVYALEKVLIELRVTKAQPQNWKWVVIALHNSLQGFMVLTLRFTNPALIARVPAPLRRWNDDLLIAYNRRVLVKDVTAKKSTEESNRLRNAYIKYVRKLAEERISPTEIEAYLQEVYERPVQLLDYQLIDFLELFNRVQSPAYAAYVLQPQEYQAYVWEQQQAEADVTRPPQPPKPPFEVTEIQQGDVAFLNQLRNEDIHFTPKTLVTHLEAIPLPRMVMSCLAVIDFLVTRGNITWHYENEARYARVLLQETRQEVMAIAATYGTSL